MNSSGKSWAHSSRTAKNSSALEENESSRSRETLTCSQGKITMQFQITSLPERKEKASFELDPSILTNFLRLRPWYSIRSLPRFCYELNPCSCLKVQRASGYEQKRVFISLQTRSASFNNNKRQCADTRPLKVWSSHRQQQQQQPGTCQKCKLAHTHTHTHPAPTQTCSKSPYFNRISRQSVCTLSWRSSFRGPLPSRQNFSPQLPAVHSFSHPQPQDNAKVTNHLGIKTVSSPKILPHHRDPGAFPPAAQQVGDRG